MIGALALLVSSAGTAALPTSEFIASTERFREAVMTVEDRGHAGFITSLFRSEVSDLDCGWHSIDVARCSYRFRISDGIGIVRDWTTQISDFRRAPNGQWSFSQSRETNLERGHQ